MVTIHEIYSNIGHLDKYSTTKFPSHLNKRFCSIGRAKRFEHIGDHCFPGPGQYSPDRESRIKTTKFGSEPRTTLAISGDLPGPGQYNPRLKQGLSFSFARRLELKLPKIPGPGDYQPKASSTSSSRVVFGTEVRKDNFLDPNLSKNPEPWKYNVPTLQSSPKWTFSCEPRVKNVDLSKLGVFEAILQDRLGRRKANNS